MKKIYKYKKDGGQWAEHYQEFVDGVPTRFYLPRTKEWTLLNTREVLDRRMPKRYDKVFTEEEFILEML